MDRPIGFEKRREDALNKGSLTLYILHTHKESRLGGCGGSVSWQREIFRYWSADFSPRLIRALPLW